MADDESGRGLPALRYGQHVIHDRGEMVSLTDMWRACGSDPSKEPAKWRRLPTTKQFGAHVASVVLRKSEDGLFEVRRGAGAGTWAHWHLALAYARYVSPEFHVWGNEAIRDRMEGIAEDRRTLPGVSDPADPVTVLRVIEHLQGQIAAQGGRLLALDRIEASTGSRCITDTAKMLKMGRDALYRWMQANRWIYRRPGTETWCAFQDKERAGLLESAPYRFTGRDGTPRVRMQVLVTPKGLIRLAAELACKLEDERR